MRVFVTGATGWVGSAVVKDLIAAGHQVLGLTRSDKGAEALAAAGAEVHRGSLADLDSLQERRRPIGCRDPHRLQPRLLEIRGELRGGPARHRGDRRRARRLRPSAARDVRRGAPRPRPHGDRGGCATQLSSFPRKSEAATAALGGTRRTGIDRPARPVGPWARRSRLRAHPDRHRAREGRVRLYRRWAAIAGRPCTGSTPPASIGSRWSAARRGAASMPSPRRACRSRQIAEVIGRRLNIPVVSKSPEEAAEHFGWFAMFAGMDAPTSSARTRAKLDWKPEQPGLIADIDHPAYFAQ